MRPSQFFNRVEEGSFPARPPAVNQEHLRELIAQEDRERHFFRSVIALSEHRFAEGEGLFGDAFMEKDLMAEAADEIADFLNYLYMRAERTEREGGDTGAEVVLLQACKEVIGGLETAMAYQGKRRGSP